MLLWIVVRIVVKLEDPAMPKSLLQTTKSAVSCQQGEPSYLADEGSANHPLVHDRHGDDHPQAALAPIDELHVAAMNEHDGTHGAESKANPAGRPIA